jgi:hypothetical protein
VGCIEIIDMSSLPQDIDFETVREGWNKYKLEDGVILRNKPFLKMLTLVSQTGTEKGYHFEIAVNTEIDVPPKIQESKPKTQNPVEIKRPEDIEKELKFDVLSNKPQIYETKENTFIFLKEIVKNVYLTKKIDVLGRPVYTLDSIQSLSVYEMKQDKDINI